MNYTNVFQTFFCAMSDRTIRTILSSDVSKQWDPDGFLFCIGAATKLQLISQALPDCFVGSIIDNVTVGAKIKQISHAIQVASLHLEEYGIRLAQHKCLVYTSHNM